MNEYQAELDEVRNELEASDATLLRLEEEIKTITRRLVLEGRIHEMLAIREAVLLDRVKK